MMLMLLSILLAVTLVVLFLSIKYKYSVSNIIPVVSQETNQTMVPLVIHTTETMIAAHEAGHTLTAWQCNLVDSVVTVTIITHGSADGSVLFNFKIGNQTDYVWCHLVIFLAGIAGEIYSFDNIPIKAKAVATDLAKAKSLAKALINTQPPWNQSDTTQASLSFNKVFTKITSEEIAILNIAYTKAKELITKHNIIYNRLISALLTKKTLSDLDLIEVLGSRDGIRFWNKNFGKATFL